MPGRRNPNRAIRYDERRYPSRHLIENAFGSLKDFRRVHARYDKLAANFLPAVALSPPSSSGFDHVSAQGYSRTSGHRPVSPESCLTGIHHPYVLLASIAMRIGAIADQPVPARKGAG
jgi:hypothetical protein